MADDELRARQLAYRIWESEGRPEGQQQKHWDMALKIVAAEQVKGNEAWVEEVGDTHEETPILEDDLPLEDDEVGIEENRLPLDEPDEASFDEVPFRDDTVATDDVPVQDRGTPDQATSSSHSPAQTLDPLPEESATASRAEHPRRAEDTVTSPDPTDTSQVPGKSAATRTRARKTSDKSGTGKSSAGKAATDKSLAGKATTGKTAASKAETGKKTLGATRSGTRKPKA